MLYNAVTILRHHETIPGQLQNALCHPQAGNGHEYLHAPANGTVYLGGDASQIACATKASGITADLADDLDSQRLVAESQVGN